jgi:taurine dioxygenase
MMIQSFEVRPLANFGLEILGLDLSAGLDESTSEKLQDLLLQKEILLFRDQNLKDQAIIDFANQLGVTQGHPLGKFTSPGFPDILLSSNKMEKGEPIGIMDIGQFWHTDGSYLPIPYMYTLLYGAEIPHDKDGKPLGDTLFLSATLAYEALPDDIKTIIGTLSAFHSYDFRYQLRLKKNPEVLSAAKAKVDIKHPIAYEHPITGRNALFVNEGYVKKIEGLSDMEVERLLNKLFSHLQNPVFGYRHQWKKGDVIVWDNVSTQHNAVADYSRHQSRLMKRVTITKSSRLTR